MGATITAIYENGVLRLLEPLDLPERTRVRIIVQSHPNLDGLSPIERREAMRALLQQTGLLVDKSVLLDGVRPLSEEEREALAQRLPADLALSDLIIQEREAR